MAQPLIDLLLEFAKQARFALTQAEQSKQNQQSKGTWEGYDADGNASIKSNGETKSKSVIGNIGLPAKSEVIADKVQTVETNEKPRPKRKRPTKKPQPVLVVGPRPKASSIILSTDEERIIYPVCIAVIDETDNVGNATLTASWNSFRSQYPSRPFFLLVPFDGINRPFVPAAMQADQLTTVVDVVRDNGSGVGSNWYSICQLDAAYAGANIFLFIDVSGSMTIATVQNSYNTFKATVEASDAVVKSVTSTNENYIDPFIRPDADFEDGINVWPQ